MQQLRKERYNRDNGLSTRPTSPALQNDLNSRRTSKQNNFRRIKRAKSAPAPAAAAPAKAAKAAKLAATVAAPREAFKPKALRKKKHHSQSFGLAEATEMFENEMNKMNDSEEEE